jgi:hypothetical protein
MLLTVGQLKSMLQNVPDECLFGSMDFASSEFKLYAPKRGLLVEGQGSQYLLLNNMGTHWDEKWTYNGEFKLIGSVDRETGEITNI